MITIQEIRDTSDRLAGKVVRTPLLRLPLPDAPPGMPEIHIKLECLQPIASFKIRGAMSFVSRIPGNELTEGIWTASAGNMAQAAAWCARELAIPCTVIVPETAPETKLAAVERLGGTVIRVSFDRWWQVFVEGNYPGMTGRFVHPFDDPAVMAGNGTIGLEILEDLPDADTILVPWGGGGLACGIAEAVGALSPRTRVFAAESATSSPLAASLAAGSPQRVTVVPSFVDGIAGPAVFPSMLARAQRLLAGSLVAGLDTIEYAVLFLMERARIVAEGAGACPVALALSQQAPGRKIVCVVSGGNIDRSELARILTLDPRNSPFDWLRPGNKNQ